MDNMTPASPSLSLSYYIASMLPEVQVCLAAIILLMGGVFAGDRSATKMHALGLFALISLAGMMLVSPLPFDRQYLFQQMFVSDNFTKFVKLLLVVGTALVFLIADGWLAEPQNSRPEFTVLMLFSLLGMLLMVSANDLIALYMGMELSSLALYVLASFSRDSLKSTESGIKYFVLGSLASGLFLFGASLVYGFSGATEFFRISEALKSSQDVSPGLLVGLVLMTAAFCFKISAAPFHMWTPDVYEGAPTPVTAYFSIAPKIAALALLMRLLEQPFLSMHAQWQQVIVAASIASLLVGAFGALGQSNIKRLLAYSSIGHVGYALIALAAGNTAGTAAILVYFSLYLFMSAGAFACVLMMKRNGNTVEAIADLAGLSRTQPRMAFALSVFMFSMAGIPPLAGFFGKMYIFLAAIESGLTTLAVIGVLASVVACFYYLKVVKVMYFDEAADAPLDSAHPRATRLVMTACMLVTFLFFLIPAPLVNHARAAAEALFH